MTVVSVDCIKLDCGSEWWVPFGGHTVTFVTRPQFCVARSMATLLGPNPKAGKSNIRQILFASISKQWLKPDGSLTVALCKHPWYGEIYLFQAVSS